MIRIQQIETPIKIRSYAPDDYESVNMLIQSFAGLYNYDFDERIFESAMQSRFLDNTVGTFIAESNGEIYGSAFADTEHDPRGVLRGRISNVMVKEDCQGMGCGSALVGETTQFLSAFNVESIWANVNPNNPGMVHLFEKRDFHPAFITMEKSLSTFNAELPGDFGQGEIRYRTSIPHDIPAVRSLVQDLATSLGEPFNPYWFDLNVQNYFRGANAGILCADLNEKIVGITFVETRRDPMGFPFGYISNIIVNREIQKTGIGKNLLQLATSFLARLRVRKILGNINYGNRTMQKLYEKCGFEHRFTVMNKPANLYAGC